ncbi:hypothetical protein DXG01_001477 [Tephrocybe rancida]|nr:hypothetical protein DXG01_001477 [Tephrocybe rancida]
MESLNLHTLANSLPTAQQNAEKELTNNFKAAALSITTLYRSSRKNSKRAYNAGYAAACQDLLTMIQQGVSLSPNPSAPSHDPDHGGLTIGRVMDWTEARLEAIRSREEEEDEEEEREREREGGGKSQPIPVVGNVPKVDTKPPRVPVASVPRTKAPTPPQATSLPTPSSPRSSQPQPSAPSSPSPPPPAALRPIQRPIRSRGSAKADLIPGSMDFANGPSTSESDTIPIPIAAGAKRRHAMMMMLDSAPSAVSIDSSVAHPPPMGGNNLNSASGSRRRTRSSRHGHAPPQNQNFSLIAPPADAMEVEEDGRERKRVARR